MIEGFVIAGGIFGLLTLIVTGRLEPWEELDIPRVFLAFLSVSFIGGAIGAVAELLN